jgi:alkylhydroperoxidase/carboxymuconolactone decarboxylase family protein YurZ
MQALSIRAVLDRHGNDTIDHRKEPTMQYCLLMHYQQAADAGVTEEAMARGRAAFEAVGSHQARSEGL